MKHRLVFSNLLLAALILALVPTALASTTWYVDGVHGSDNNDCKTPQTACKTIGHAISLASSGDSIRVAASTYTENLTIGTSLSIVGAGAKTTIIDGGGNGSVFVIPTRTANVHLASLTIRHGKAILGAGIRNYAFTLTISDSTISGNEGVAECISRCGTSGGGVYNDSGFLTVSNSTISGNMAGTQTCKKYCIADGGGIFNYGTVTINNSTLTANGATIESRCFLCSTAGGGIENQGTVTINNSTLSNNSARVGGAIFDGARTVTLQNSIVANSLGGNCGGTVTSNGYNLSDDGTCNFNNTGDRNNTPARLGRLQNNGGPTQTQALLPGSPAIDAGNPKGCTDGNGQLLKTDQRGKPRPDREDKAGCDMGAFERQKD